MIRTETVVGQPIYLDDATIVPFVDISFGFGTGNHGTNGESSGEAGGGKMSPTAVLIMKGERVELFSIKNATPNGTIDRVLNMIPEAVSHFTKKKEKKNEGLEREIPQLQEIAGKVWKKEDELKQLKSELAALDRKIQLELAPAQENTEENRQGNEKKQTEQQPESPHVDFVRSHLIIGRPGLSESKGVKL